jgi:aspartyl-tRNA(Asn)/glutamyl-tRNA(Gln) amidotransferase subunit B
MEVHVQLATRSKMFCRCSSDYLGRPPNSNVCPVCMGLPGVLPVINAAAVEAGVKAALALNCTIAPATKFDRKNYFYPDLPKGYQISQYDLPISTAGHIDVGGRRVRITRVHLEEDTGRLAHAGDQLQSADESYVDLNRSGMPLMEIVTEPDLRSADEARDYAVQLRSLLRSIGASEAEMEKGQLRAEANVSIRPRGSVELGVKTELKNINSFRALHRAIEHEIRRQEQVLDAGGKVTQETRGWSEQEQRTFSQRGKEYAHDYRYFPEPDLPPLELDPGWVAGLKASLPEAPSVRRARFEAELGLGPAQAQALAEEGDVAAYFEAVVEAGADPRQAGNWIMGELLPRRDANWPLPDALAALIALVGSGAINRDQGRQALDESLAGGEEPGVIVRRQGLAQLSDQDAIARVVDGVIAANPKAVADYRAGKQQAIGALIREVKEASGGQANLKLATELLRQRLTT